MGQGAAASELEEDMACWGVEGSAEDLLPQSDTGVWTEHVRAVEAFLSVTTQWRVVESFSQGLRVIGLDYPAVETGLRMSGIAVDPDLWGQLQLIEIGALGAMNGTAE